MREQWAFPYCSRWIYCFLFPPHRQITFRQVNPRKLSLKVWRSFYNLKTYLYDIPVYFGKHIWQVRPAAVGRAKQAATGSHFGFSRSTSALFVSHGQLLSVPCGAVDENNVHVVKRAIAIRQCNPPALLMAEETIKI